MPKKTVVRTKTLMIRSFPIHLANLAKAKAAMKGKFLNEEIIRLVTNYVKPRASRK